MTYNGLKKYKFEEISENIFSGGTPSTQKTEYWNGNINWLSSGETRNTYILNTEKKITNLGVLESSTRLAKSGDVVIASAGQGFTRGQVSLCKIDTYINQSLISVRCNSKIANNIYVFYNLKNRYNELRQISDGYSIRGSLTTKLIKELVIYLPEIPMQELIANILSSLDDKIELNNKINKNLEELAQTLYKRWFIDFEFPNEQGEPYKSSGGEMIESELGFIPKDFTINKIGYCFETVLGGTPSRRNHEFWGKGYQWLKSGELNNSRIIKGSEEITDKGLNYSATKLMPRGTVLIAITGYVGLISMLEIEACANQSVVGVIPNKNFPRGYTYSLIKNEIAEISSKQTGSAQQHINKNDINNHNFITPNQKLIIKFSKIIEYIHKKIACNLFENEKLSKLRDELLPKLMNGEIEVPIKE